jgi:hypothetical protein
MPPIASRSTTPAHHRLLPVLMFLVYLGLILYFRSRGGYKPVVLDLKK